MTPPAQIPIFPLHRVLMPDAELPLKVFEQRYLEMTKVCLRDGTPFGVCLISDGREVGAPAEHETVGCSAVIADWEMPHMGLFHLRTTGQQPFRIRERRIGAGGLIEADVDWLADEPGDPDAELLGLCRRILEGIASRLGPGIFAGQARLDDPRWISYRLADLLPVPPAAKQSLLEERIDARRLARIAELLKAD